MAKYEVVYWELTRISRMIDAKTMELAIAKSEKLRADGEWSDCEEDSEGTNGVERVYKWSRGIPSIVYDSGTVCGMVDAPEDK